MIIRNDASHLISFAFRDGRRMTEDRCWHESKLNHLLYLFSNITGKKADIQNTIIRFHKSFPKGHTF
jgi:hypothetical protein